MAFERKFLYLSSFLLALSPLACGKKDKKDDEQSSLSANVTTPVNALSIVSLSIKSASSGIGPSARAFDSGFSESDCDEHAEPKARAGDNPDSSGRLMWNHPRYALQHMYCMVQKDTGAPDSFIGSLSQSKFLACLMSGNIRFDGAEHEVTMSKASIIQCAKDHIAADQQDEIAGQIPDAGISAKIIAGLGAQNPINTTGGWDAGMKLSFEFAGQPMSLGLLVSDNANTMAVGVTNSSQGAAINQDGYVASIDKANGAIRYESMFQRIRTVNGTQSNGWNRHARIYVKGTMDPSNYQFSSVSKAQGIYSDISVNDMNTTPPATSNPAALPLKNGHMWTVNGASSGGFASKFYMLGTLAQPNLKASWETSTPVSACDGQSGGGCTNPALALSSDVDTAFVMDLNNSSFTKVEDWMKVTSALNFTDLTFAATQN